MKAYLGMRARLALIATVLGVSSSCATHATMLGHRPAQANESFYAAFLDGGQVQEYARRTGSRDSVIQMLPVRIFRRDITTAWGLLAKGGAQIYHGEVQPGDAPPISARAGFVQLVPLECDDIPRTMSRVDTLTKCVATLGAAELTRRESALLRKLDEDQARDTTLLIACTTGDRRNPCMRGGLVYTLIIGRGAANGDGAMFPVLVGRRSKGVSLAVGVASFALFYIWDFRRNK
jgi:hypothetical protein